MAVFLAYSRTSVVMASGRELCIVLLLGESHDMKLFFTLFQGFFSPTRLHSSSWRDHLPAAALYSGDVASCHIADI